jgi:energy-coupling factor transporter ATP-binding protein EcfA2
VSAPAHKRLEPHDVVLIVGKRGCGKSFLAKLIASSEMKAAARVAWFDPHDEYSQKGRKSPQVNLGPLRDRVTVDELIEHPELLDAKNLSLAIVPDGVPTDELADAFADIAELIAATGRVTFGADELGEYSDEAAGTINSLATQSRHYETALILAAQRMTQIPKTARTQASIVHTFLQSNPEDLEALVKLTGDKDFAARVSRLPRRKHLTWRDSEQTS